MSTDDAGARSTALRDIDRVLGVLDERTREGLDDELQALLDERAAARAARDWAASDRLRDALAERGVAVEDTRDGQRWRRIARADPWLTDRRRTAKRPSGPRRARGGPRRDGPRPGGPRPGAPDPAATGRRTARSRAEARPRVRGPPARRSGRRSRPHATSGPGSRRPDGTDRGRAVDPGPAPRTATTGPPGPRRWERPSPRPPGRDRPARVRRAPADRTATTAPDRTPAAPLRRDRAVTVRGRPDRRPPFTGDRHPDRRTAGPTPAGPTTAHTEATAIPPGRPVASGSRHRRPSRRRPSPPPDALGPDEELSPVAVRSKRHSSPGARRPVTGRPATPRRRSKSSCSTRRTCGSRSSRSKADRSRHSPASMVTRASPWSWSRVGSPTLDDILARAAERGEPPFILVLDSLEDPHNVGLAAAQRRGSRRPRRDVPDPSPGAPQPVRRQGVGRRRRAPAAAPRRGPGRDAGDLHARGVRIVGAEARRH